MAACNLLRRATCALALAGVVALSCGGDDDDGAASPTRSRPTETRTAADTPTPPALEPETTLAAFIIEVVEGDAEAVVDRLIVQDVPCAPDSWPQPECEPAEQAGTVKPRVPFVGCEPAFLDEAEAAAVLRQVLVNRGPSLHSAAETRQSAGDGPFVLSPLAVVFQTVPPPGIEHPTGVLVVLDMDGGILSFRTGCRASPQGLLEALSVSRSLDLGPHVR